MKVKVKQWKHHKRAVCFYSHKRYNGSLCCSTSPLRVFSVAVMGGNSSAPSPPPSPLLETPWRKITWGDNQRDLHYVNNFQPNNEVKAIRVLLYGPVGGGKSSFINSVCSVLRGRMSTPALACHRYIGAFYTAKYKTHRIRKDRENFYPLAFTDTRGLEEGPHGVSANDIKLALMGHVKEGYQFNPVSPLSAADPDYNSAPSIDDRVHVLVCVHSTSTIQLRPSILQQMKIIREAASDLGIPQLAVLTNIDRECCETEKILRNVYRSKYLQKRMRDFSSSLGIPMNCILPVKNYSHEIQLDPDIDTLILNALRLMIDFGDDFVDKLST